MTKDAADLGPNSLDHMLAAGSEAELRALCNTLIQKRFLSDARKICKRLIELDPNDLGVRYTYASLADDGTHKVSAEARDGLLAIIDELPGIVNESRPQMWELLRAAAVTCSRIGPIDRGIELYRKLAPATKEASDYFALSELLAQKNLLEESLETLRAAIALNPAAYDTPTNRETLALGVESGQSARAAPQKNRPAKLKIGRYPLTTDFKGDFQNLLKNHIAVDLALVGKFISPKTKFFTMGSCFARNVSQTLIKKGYTSRHMEISEHINTTFANKVFVDWLEGKSANHAVNERIRELLPPTLSPETTVEKIKDSDVFILTLGVAPAFFDRATGAFVLPRPTALNSRVLAEKYEYRNTTVKENVDNALYLINFMRRVSPDIKIIVTVSPVPIIASFGNASCVQADCLSKSTMRVAAHEIVNGSGLTNIHYWPSFEVFRWAGSNASEYYAADDGAAWHVSEEKVSGTIEAFLDMFRIDP